MRIQCSQLPDRVLIRWQLRRQCERPTRIATRAAHGDWVAVVCQCPDPDLEILTICEYGKVSTLAAATLRQLGFHRAVALDGGMKLWRDAIKPIESGEAS